MPRQKVQLAEHTQRWLTVPTGTTLHVPTDSNWHIEAIAVLPTVDYGPPGTLRDNVSRWGDVQLRIGDNSEGILRVPVLTLMDRYWGRYNISSECPELFTRLEEAKYALATAPDIPTLRGLIEIAHRSLLDYWNSVEPHGKSVFVKGGDRILIEHLDCEASPPREVNCIDVELYLTMTRKVGDAFYAGET